MCICKGVNYHSFGNLIAFLIASFSVFIAHLLLLSYLYGYVVGSGGYVSGNIYVQPLLFRCVCMCSVDFHCLLVGNCHKYALLKVIFQMFKFLLFG